MADRPSRDAYYMDIARAVAARGTCSRARVGAIAVVNDVIKSTGFNGAPRATRHCDHSPRMARDQVTDLRESRDVLVEPGDMENGHCARAVHAEANVVLNAAREGMSLYGGTLYVTVTPCYRCAPMIVQAGFARVVYGGDYRPDERALALLKEAEVEIVKL